MYKHLKAVLGSKAPRMLSSFVYPVLLPASFNSAVLSLGPLSSCLGALAEDGCLRRGTISELFFDSFLRCTRAPSLVIFPIVPFSCPFRTWGGTY